MSDQLINEDTLIRPLTAARSLLVSARPLQWVKNVFVLAGLVFSDALFEPETLRLSLEAFLLFCCASSSVYLVNDLHDVVEDRLHSIKQKRPLAAGQVSRRSVSMFAAVLTTLAVGLSFGISKSFGAIVCVYLLTSLAYTLWLKHAPVLDVMTLAAGFVLRAAGGVIAIGLVPSPWLVLCTLTLALLVGFGKRRNELLVMQGHAVEHRAAMSGYSVPFLDMMMGVSASAAIVTYALYTVSTETVQRFETHLLALTTPFVIYGVFRYLFLVYERTEGGDPSTLFVTDKPMLINSALWAIAVTAIVTVPHEWLPWWALT